MKVSESEREYELGDIPGEYICDFCNKGFDLLWSLNAGLWAVCTRCMDAEYGGEEE